MVRFIYQIVKISLCMIQNSSHLYIIKLTLGPRFTLVVKQHSFTRISITIIWSLLDGIIITSSNQSNGRDKDYVVFYSTKSISLEKLIAWHIGCVCLSFKKNVLKEGRDFFWFFLKNLKLFVFAYYP